MGAQVTQSGVGVVQAVIVVQPAPMASGPGGAAEGAECDSHHRMQHFSLSLRRVRFRGSCFLGFGCLPLIWLYLNAQVHE